MSDQRIGVAVVGCGGISAVHLQALSRMEDVRVAACCDILQEKADKAAAPFGASSLTDWRRLVGQDGIDFVHLCTPHHLHAPLAIEFLRAGQTVLTEKPMAHEEADMDALIAADNGRVGVVFQNRYNECAQRARAMLADGSLGKLIGLRGAVCWKRTPPYYTQSGWRGTWATEGGGSLINQAIHTLDLVQWMGGPVATIAGRVSTDSLQGVIEVEDTAHAFLRFESGATGIFYSTNAHAYDAPVEVEMVFEQGKLLIRGEALYRETDAGLEALVAQNTAGTVGKSYWGHGHAALIRDFYDCMKTGRRFFIDAAEGAKALRLLKRLYKASASGTPQVIGI